MRAGQDGGGNRRAKGAGLARTGHPDGAAGDVGIDLHGEGILVRNAAGTNDVLHRHAILLDPFDDGARAKRGGLNQRAVNLGPAGVKRLTKQETGQHGIDQDGAVTIVPVQGE